jgi:hypothetical protein
MAQPSGQESLHAALPRCNHAGGGHYGGSRFVLGVQPGGRGMLSFPGNARVYLCMAAVDLGKSFDGLGGLVQSVL